MRAFLHHHYHSTIICSLSTILLSYPYTFIKFLKCVLFTTFLNAHGVIILALMISHTLIKQFPFPKLHDYCVFTNPVWQEVICFVSTQWHSQSQWLCNYNRTTKLCPDKASWWFSTEGASNWNIHGMMHKITLERSCLMRNKMVWVFPSNISPCHPDWPSINALYLLSPVMSHNGQSCTLLRDMTYTSHDSTWLIKEEVTSRHDHWRSTVKLKVSMLLNQLVKV